MADLVQAILAAEGGDQQTAIVQPGGEVVAVLEGEFIEPCVAAISGKGCEAVESGG